MTAAPRGQKKSAEENKVAEAASTGRSQRTEKEQKTVEKAVDKKPSKNTDARAKVTTGSPKEGEALPKAEPEAVSQPGDEQRPAEDDNATPTGIERDDNDPVKDGPAVFSVAPSTPGPNESVPEGKVEVTRKAEEGQASDPSGNRTERAARTSKPKKSDPLKKIEDFGKLPVAVSVGDITASVEEYSGQPVLSLSLRGWVGDAPLKILASQIDDIEGAIAELRKQLS